MSGSAQFDESAVDQLSHVIVPAELREQLTAAAGVRLIHDVAEHRVHHLAFFGAGLPEAPPEVLPAAVRRSSFLYVHPSTPLEMASGGPGLPPVTGLRNRGGA